MKTSNSAQTQMLNRTLQVSWGFVLRHFDSKYEIYLTLIGLLYWINPLEANCPQALTDSIHKILFSESVNLEALVIAFTSLKDHQERKNIKSCDLTTNENLSNVLAKYAQNGLIDEVLIFLYNFAEMLAVETMLKENNVLPGLINYVNWRASNQIYLEQSGGFTGEKGNKKNNPLWILFHVFVGLCFIGLLAFLFLTYMMP